MKESDLACETESGAGSRGRQQDGDLEPRTVEDERFLDHHIEEILGTLSHTARTRESDLDVRSESLE
jgi:hypothetical protein